MTLDNCIKLLEQYNKIIDGTIMQPEGHKDWGLVKKNAKIAAEEMSKRIEHKLTLPKYANYKETEVKVEETEVKVEVKEDDEE